MNLNEKKTFSLLAVLGISAGVAVVVVYLSNNNRTVRRAIG